MSYNEKSIWASLLISIYILTHYIAGLMQSVLTEAILIDLFIEALVWSILLNIAIQVVLGILYVKEAAKGEDERDQLFGYKSDRFGYFFLSLTVISVFGQVYLSTLDSFDLPNYLFTKDLAPQYSLCNTLLVGFLLSEIAKYGAQLFYYRKSY